MAKNKSPKILTKKHLARQDRERRQTRLISWNCHWDHSNRGSGHCIRTPERHLIPQLETGGLCKWPVSQSP